MGKAVRSRQGLPKRGRAWLRLDENLLTFGAFLGTLFSLMIAGPPLGAFFLGGVFRQTPTAGMQEGPSPLAVFPVVVVAALASALAGALAGLVSGLLIRLTRIADGPLARGLVGGLAGALVGGAYLGVAGYLFGALAVGIGPGPRSTGAQIHRTLVQFAAIGAVLGAVPMALLGSLVGAVVGFSVRKKGPPGGRGSVG